VIGTMGTGFLQNDAAWRTLPRLPPGELRSPFYFRLNVDDRPGVLAHVTAALAEHDVSVARIVQHPNENGAAVHVVTHEAAAGALGAALAEIAELPESRERPMALPVVSDRGVQELGWA
jgi:hypothetical protein